MQLGNARHTSGGRDMGVQLVLGEWTAASGLETRKEKKGKRKGHCLEIWFGPANGGGKWAKLG